MQTKGVEIKLNTRAELSIKKSPLQNVEKKSLHFVFHIDPVVMDVIIYSDPFSFPPNLS